MRAEYNGRIVDVVDLETGAYRSGEHSLAYTNPANLKVLPEIVPDEIIFRRKRGAKIEG